MNQRERWVAAMRFQPVDHVPDQEFGYWDEVFPLWHEQGLARCITNDERADAFFGFETKVWAPGRADLIPQFERKVIEEDDRCITIADSGGTTRVVYKDGSSTIPRYLKFPVETRRDWEEFRKRLDPATPGRFPGDAEWERWEESVQGCTRPLGVYAASLFGKIRDWMGFENVSYAIMDDPRLIQEIMDHLTSLALIYLQRPLARGIQFDLAAMWEDMCFNHGPMLQPRLFEEWMVPRLSRITGLLAEHGCDVVFVDCDGNINELVPLWLDAGVNCMFPLEAQSGTDPVRLREKYGQRVLLMGGVDKTRLIAGKDEIKKEIARLKPLVEDGGYIPHVDHRVPPDVTYENYLYYLKLKRETFGIPEPEPWEDRKDGCEWAAWDGP
jgi:uroporphyrinogen decarboxylase